MKNFRERERGHIQGERGRIQGLPTFWVPPIISGTEKPMDFKFGQYIQGPSQQKAIRNLRETGAWAYSGTAHAAPTFSGTPYYLRKG